MKTTAVIVEIAIIGFGFLIAIGILLVSFYSGFLKVFEEIPVAISLTLSLVISYVIGIIVDRISDVAFGTFEDNIRKKILGSSFDEFNRVRAVVFEESEHVKDWVNYSRQRLRVSRGWAFVSSVFCVLLIVLFMGNVVPKSANELLKISLWISFFIGIGSFFSWFDLTSGESKRIKREYARLMDLKNTQSEASSVKS